MRTWSPRPYTPGGRNSSRLWALTSMAAAERQRSRHSEEAVVRGARLAVHEAPLRASRATSGDGIECITVPGRTLRVLKDASITYRRVTTA